MTKNKKSRTLKAASAIATAVPLVGLAAIYAGQRYLIYPGAGQNPAVWKDHEEPYRQVELTTTDGLTLQALYHPANKGMHTILYFHGNGETIAESKIAMGQLIQHGYGALLVEYRGYAGNPGTPSEEGLYRDAEAAWAWLRAHRINATNTIIAGYSLGTGVASHLAVNRRPAGVILIAAFQSLPETVSQLCWWIPANLLLRDRYDTISRIGQINAPILLIHGADDQTVSAHNSKILLETCQNAQLHILKDVDHSVIYSAGAQKKMALWLESLPSNNAS